MDEALQSKEWERGAGFSNTDKDYKAKRPSQNNTASFEQWHDKEFGLTCKMDDEVKTEALARCSMWC